MKRPVYFLLLTVLTIVLHSCCNNSEMTNYSVLDSREIVGGKQYLVSCKDSDWLSMYNYGYNLLNTQPKGSVIGFFINLPDSVRFKPNGAIPDGMAKKSIAIMQYDSGYSNYVLRKIIW